MLVKDQRIQVKISNNGAYYRNLGYGDCRQKDIIYVSIDHLPKESNKDVLVVCDVCSVEFTRPLQSVIRKDVHHCKSCSYIERSKKISTKGIPRPNQRGESHWRYKPQETYEKEYRKLVRNLSNANYKEFKNLIDPENVGRQFITEEGGHHLDHIVSVAYGLEHDIDYRIISSPMNLRVCCSKYNLKKNSKCDISIDELLCKIEDSNFDINRDPKISIDYLKRETKEERVGRLFESRSAAGKKGAKKNAELGLGIFGLTPEQRSINAKAGNSRAKELRTGIFGMTKEELSEAGRRGGSGRAGFKWYNDGETSYQYQHKENFDEFLEENPQFRKGRAVNK